MFVLYRVYQTLQHIYKMYEMIVLGRDAVRWLMPTAPKTVAESEEDWVELSSLNEVENNSCEKTD